jgi:8-oxo-dGDP phosphatase
MRWEVQSERPAYTSRWVSVHLARIQPPHGPRHEHHVVRLPNQGAGAVVSNAAGEVLLIWRHRFITGRWGWEIPAGRIDLGEDAVTAAVREVHEETGWRVRSARLLCSLSTTPGLADQRSHVIHAHAEARDEAPSDPDEAAEIRWWPAAELGTLLRAGEIDDGFTMAGLLWYLHLGPG